MYRYCHTCIKYYWACPLIKLYGISSRVHAFEIQNMMMYYISNLSQPIKVLEIQKYKKIHINPCRIKWMVLHGFKDSPLNFFSNLDRFPNKGIITFICMLQCTCTFQFISIELVYMTTYKDRICHDSISIFIYIYIEITQEK